MHSENSFVFTQEIKDMENFKCMVAICLMVVINFLVPGVCLDSFR